MRTARQLSITLPNDMADALGDRVSASEYASESRHGNGLDLNPKAPKEFTHKSGCRVGASACLTNASDLNFVGSQP